MANRSPHEDAQPLADALNKIVELTTAAESDPQLMLELLNEIIETAEASKLAYLENVMVAQRKELEALRARPA